MTTLDPVRMTITVGYDLPFGAHVVTTAGEVLRIRVRCEPGTRHKAMLRVETHVAVFLDAALFGMGAGVHVSPRLDRRSIDDVLRVGKSGASQEEIVLEAPVVVDPSYVTVLLHKLLGLSELVAIEEVSVELPGLSSACEPIPTQRGEVSVLPELHLPLPFPLHDERSGHAAACTLTILYVEPPNAQALDVLQEGLRVFIAQALQGGFISPPMGPDDYFVNADDEVAVDDEQVTWTMEDFDLPSDSLNGLVSFLIGYHRQVSRLREVTLE